MPLAMAPWFSHMDSQATPLRSLWGSVSPQRMEACREVAAVGWDCGRGMGEGKQPGKLSIWEPKGIGMSFPLQRWLTSSKPA